MPIWQLTGRIVSIATPIGAYIIAWIAAIKDYREYGYRDILEAMEAITGGLFIIGMIAWFVASWVR